MQYTKICSCFTKPVPPKCTSFGLGDKHSSTVDCCFDCFMLKVPAVSGVSGLLDREKILQEYTLLGNLSAHHIFTLSSQLSETNTAVSCVQLIELPEKLVFLSILYTIATYIPRH